MYRILSLDGGGAWALLQAMALKDLFGDVPGRQILSNFDLAVGNSGGSIVLGGLVEDRTPSNILDLFNDQQKRESIFVKLSAVQRLLSHFPIFPKYSTAGKLKGLASAFGPVGGMKMGDLQGASWVQSENNVDVKILIVAFDYDSMRARFFRSYNTVHGATADDVPLVQAVHASSDAPVEFFDRPTEWDGFRYWDGAMAGLNNPLLAGLIDLLGERVSPSEIVALSLGTGTVKLAPPNTIPAPSATLQQSRENPGILANVKRAAGCITDDPPDMATFTAHTILAAAQGLDPTVVGSVVRMSPVVRPILSGGSWKIPQGLTENQFASLAQLGMDAVEQDQVDLIKVLGEGWLVDKVPNQPIRMRSDNLSTSLGEDLYSEAKARWARLMAQ